MSNLPKTDELAALVDKTFDIISYIFDKKLICLYPTPAAIIIGLSEASKNLSLFDVQEIKPELWNISDPENKLDTITEFIKLKFERLVKCKFLLIELSELNKELSTQVESFFNKQSLLFINYTNEERVRIKRFYIKTCHQLVKLNQDFYLILFDFEKTIRQNQYESDKRIEKIYKLNNLNIRDDFKTEFSSFILNAFNNGYFVYSDQTLTMSKEDILEHFSFLLHTKLEIPTELKSATTIDIIDQELAKSNFVRYLNHKNRDLLAEKIKKSFIIEKSKNIRYLIEALQLHSPSLLTINPGHKNQFYKDLKNFFNRDIGTKNSIFQCSFEPDNPHNSTDKEALLLFNKRIKGILSSL